MVNKALIPAAGLGTRFLPATKVVPKELLPIVDKPSIQYIVEEIVASGIRDIVLITARGKSLVKDHFDITYELEDLLKKQGKKDLLEMVQKISHMVHLIAVRQKEPLGLGHAILCGRSVLEHGPFAVLLPDDLIDQEIPCTKQMMDLFAKYEGAIIAVQRVPKEYTHLYGIIDAEEVGERVYRIKNMVEKPPSGTAPSNLAIIGRYILPPEIFPILEHLPPGRGGEIQITDGLLELTRRGAVYAFEFPGYRYDAGDKFGFLQANIMYALKDRDLAPRLRRLLKEIS
jgi:UTP--glucose-1-phosphate uridylyltransferase